jgi:histidyl-tRNA synthetase
MSEKSEKSNRLKARLPRGLADRGPAEIAATRKMLETIRGVYERYGFEPVETPAIEYTDALGKFLPDQDRPNEGVFSFQDDDEQWLSLRYDLTAPLARYVAERMGTADFTLPYRSYREGWVFRNEKPGPGRYRQFMQFDADTVGSASMAADAEICMMAADTMEALGIKRGDYVVKFSNRKIFDGVLDVMGFDEIVDASRRLAVLRAIDKLDRLGVAGVRALLQGGRTDESGDFTKGADLGEGGAQVIIELLTGSSIHNPSAAIQPRENPALAEMKGGVGFLIPPTLTFNNISLTSNPHVSAGLDESNQIRSLVEGAGYGPDRIRFDASVVRGLEYYTGPVYEVELTFETKDEHGRPVRFGSVGGGGRYDGLVARFRGEPVPATGFSIGVSRLQAALAHLGKLDGAAEAGPVVVTVFDKDRIADYQRMVQQLRSADIRAELYLGNPRNLGNQLKYADRRNAPCVIIQGGDEKANNEVTIKDLALGAELAKPEKGRDEYLQKQAQAQRTVPEDKLVETVREILSRHASAR